MCFSWGAQGSLRTFVWSLEPQNQNKLKRLVPKIEAEALYPGILDLILSASVLQSLNWEYGPNKSKYRGVTEPCA